MSFFNSIGRMGRSARPKKSPSTPSTPQFDHFGGAGGMASPTGYPGAPQSPMSPGGYGMGGGQGKPLYLCNPFVRSTLVKGSFKTIVVLPKYVERNEWIAVNIFDFFNNLNQFYGVVTEFCTLGNCQTMSAGHGVDYTWLDQNRKQVKLPAPQYIDYVMTWVGGLLNDETVFPTKASRDFPPTFPTTAKHIYKQLLRVFAHIYHAHFHQLLHLCCEGHFNSLFAHFIAFGKEFDLIDQKDLRANAGSGSAPGITELVDAWVAAGTFEKV